MKLSIIIPVYNQEELIIKCLDSIPYKDDLEIIVIDDASTDDTYNVLERYLGKRHITILRNETNKGPGYSRNKGIDKAIGEYIMFLDSDDYLYPEFNKFYEYLHDKDIIYYGLRENNGVSLMLNENNNKVICGTVKAIRKDFIGDTRYPETYYAEDYHFNKMLLDKNPTMEFTNLYVLHYNHPRKGSLFDIGNKAKRGD